MAFSSTVSAIGIHWTGVGLRTRAAIARILSSPRYQRSASMAKWLANTACSLRMSVHQSPWPGSRITGPRAGINDVRLPLRDLAQALDDVAYARGPAVATILPHLWNRVLQAEEVE